MAAFDVIIIGGGLGGLLCGNILSKEGLNVCLVEKNHKLGGSLQTFGRKACIFNTGLNYTESLENGQVLNQYFRYFGLIGKLNLKKLDEKGFEVIHFNDGKYQYAMGRHNFIETLVQQFPSQREGLIRYTQKINDICMGIPMYTFSTMPSRMMDDTSISTSAAGYIESVISDPRLRNILAGNSMLYSGHQQKTPLYIHALINNSFIESAWRIADGSHHLVNLLAEQITANGGCIYRNSKAEKIKVSSGKAEYVELEGGERIFAKHVIANIHPSHVLEMVDKGAFRKVFHNRIMNLKDTMGMFTLYLVFKKNSFPYHNYNFYHFEQDNAWIASDYQPDKWPQNYLFMPVSMSSSDKYASCASVITYMDYLEVSKWENTFTGDRGQEYLDFKESKAEILLRSVEKQFPGIRNQIEAHFTSTPLTWRDYTGTRAGSAYGILKDCSRPLESMILPRTQIPNVYLTGQNTNVHGILGVTISSVVTCAEIIDGKDLLNKIKSS